MSELGSLYIKLGEPEGELCGCTCEVGDWAAKHIADITEQRDKLLAVCEDIYGYFGDDFWDSSGMSDETHVNLKAAIAEAKGET